MSSHRYLIILLMAITALIPRSGSAQDSWLDGAQGVWNTSGMVLPATTSPPAPGIEQCQSLVRPAETAEDAAVAAYGWRLYGAYQRG